MGGNWMARSPAYIHQLKTGPFPGRVDPWAEAGRYFHQIHGSVIDHLVDQIQDLLLERGYIAGKEVSLQIVEGRQPDLFVTREQDVTTGAAWDYEAAAIEILVEPGTAILSSEPELQALHIKALDTAELVTVVEIISPSNKTHPQEIALYQQQRGRLFLSQAVNVVEIDATRSVKRLLDHPLTNNHPYHIAVYLPGELPRVIVSEFEQPLKRFALPLRAEVIPVELHQAYERAYQRFAIAGQIQNESRYNEGDLPFPSLLTSEQRRDALSTVAEWQQTLARLSQS
jgi:hypothetical protein